MEIPLHAPPIKPMVEFFEANGYSVPQTVTWHEAFKLLDQFQLWHKVGDTFKELGLIHPFDPNDIPASTKSLLDMYARRWSDKTCGELLEALEAAPGLCIGTYGNELEKAEMTALESFNACRWMFLDPTGKIFNPGSCSEVGYKSAASALHIRPECELKTTLWNGHVEVWAEGEPTEDILHSYLDSGMPISSNGLSDLFIDYYISSMHDEEKNGDIKRANEIADLLLELNPNDTAVLTFKADRLIDEGKKWFKELADCYFDDARGIAKRVQELGDFYRTEQILTRIEIEQGGGKELSMEQAKRLVIENPWDAVSYVGMALAAFRQGDVVNAFSYLDTASTMPGANDKDEKAWISSIMEYMRRELKTRVTKLEAEAISDASKTAKLGDLYYASGETEKAEKTLRTALEFDPRDANSIVLLTSLLKGKGKTQEAEEMLLASLKDNDPDEIKMYLANQYIEENRYSDAEHLLVRLTRSGNKGYRAEAFNALADMARYRDNDLDNADKFYQQALFTDPDNLGAHTGIAYCAIQLGDFAVAKEHLDLAASIDPFDEWLYYTKASYHLWQGEYGQALAYAGLSERLGGYPSAGHEGFALLDTDRYVSAEKAFRRALDYDPWNTFAVAGLVIALAGQGFDYERELKDLLASNIPSEDLFYTIGRLAEAHGDLVSAIKFYNYSASVKDFFKDPVKRLKGLGQTVARCNVGDAELAEAHRYAEENLP